MLACATSNLLPSKRIRIPPYERWLLLIVFLSRVSCKLLRLHKSSLTKVLYLRTKGGRVEGKRCLLRLIRFFETESEATSEVWLVMILVHFIQVLEQF